jgi:hypothetical protein
MSRRTLRAGSVVRRLVVLGVLTAFCLMVFGSAASASLHPWGNTPTPVTNVVKASDDPYGGDRVPPVKAPWYDRLLLFLGLKGHPQLPSNDRQNVSTKNDTTTATTTAR